MWPWKVRQVPTYTSGATDARWLPATSEMQTDPTFNAIWNVIKTWDVNVPAAYGGYCGATGNHVRAIWEALPAGSWQPMETFPRDGESYLVCDRRILDGFQQVVFFDDEAKNRWCLSTSDGPTFHFDAFTHWMKLPRPPAFPE